MLDVFLLGGKRCVLLLFFLPSSSSIYFASVREEIRVLHLGQNHNLKIEKMSSVSVGDSGGGGIGVPRRCPCGGGVVVYTSTTERNPGRQFFRCENFKKPNVGHVFKWVDETMVEELECIRDEQKRLSEEAKEEQKRLFEDAKEDASKRAMVERSMLVTKFSQIEAGQEVALKTMKKGFVVAITILCLVLLKMVFMS